MLFCLICFLYFEFDIRTSFGLTDSYSPSASSSLPSVTGVVSVVGTVPVSVVEELLSSAAAVPQLGSGSVWEFGENLCSSGKIVYRRTQMNAIAQKKLTLDWANLKKLTNLNSAMLVIVLKSVVTERQN